jgi:mono/diheme cytochrome c family protein
MAQVEAGRKLYVEQHCSTCHGVAMSGGQGVPSLNDAGFRNAWKNRSLESLLDCTRKSMPPGRQGTLSDTQYIAVIAAILEANGFRPGAASMPTDAAALSRIVMEETR